MLNFFNKFIVQKVENQLSADLDGYEDFDGDLYLRQNPDVAKSGLKPLTHYVKYGKAEGRAYPKIRPSMKDDPDYLRILRSGYFDPEWYLMKYPDLVGSQYTPLEHFLDFGVWEGRDPGPFFSTSWYWAQYPDIVGTNPLLHYLDFGKAEGRSPAPPKNGIEAASSVYASIRDLDPELNSIERFSWFRGVPFVDGSIRNNPIKQALQNLIDATSSSITHFIFVPWLVRGGADLVAVNICRLAEHTIGLRHLAVVVLDFDRTDSADWLPKDVHVINFARYTSKLSRAQADDVLAKYIQIVRPKKILNINSGMTWDLFRDRGRFANQHSELYACVFCRDFNKWGQPSGYADTHFRDTILNLRSIYLDNATFRGELISQFGILPSHSEKLVVVRQQIKLGLAKRKPDRPLQRKRMHVLWASRIVGQKNYRLLAQIINGCSKNVSFSVWGEGEPSVIEEFRSLLAAGANVEIKGNFTSFETLPLEDYDAYLYTSLWDGIPNAILEAAAYGFPIVCSNVGGISEVINADRGWLIEDAGNPLDYVVALNQIASDRGKAWIKGDRLRSFVIATHSQENALKALSSTGQFLEVDDGF